VSPLLDSLPHDNPDARLLLAGTAAFLNIQLISWFQQRVDRGVLGRVMSVLMFAAVVSYHFRSQSQASH
jgi:hypothetical protein